MPGQISPEGGVETGVDVVGARRAREDEFRPGGPFHFLYGVGKLDDTGREGWRERGRDREGERERVENEKLSAR